MADNTPILHGDTPDAAPHGRQASRPESRPDTRWLCYDEIVELTGLSRDAAIRTARRNRWERQAGHVAGVMRFAVSTSELAELRKAASDRLAVAESKDGPAKMPKPLGAIQRKSDALALRDDELEGNLWEQMERANTRAEMAEAALHKAKRRLDKYDNALETMQVAVAARAAAEATLAGNQRQLTSMQSMVDAERATGAVAMMAERAQHDALAEEIRQTAEQLAGTTAARDAAELALAEASRRQALIEAEFAAERFRLEAALAEQQLLVDAYAQQLQHANAAVHATAAQRVQAEAALSDALETLRLTGVAATAELARLEEVHSERLHSLDRMREEAQENAHAAYMEAGVERDRAQAACNEAAALMEAHAVEIAAAAERVRLSESQMQIAAEARDVAEASVAQLNEELEEVRRSSVLERTHIEAVFSERLHLAEAALGAAQQATCEARATALAEQAARLAEFEDQVRRADELRQSDVNARHEAEAALVTMQHQLEAARQCSLTEQAQSEADFRIRLADMGALRDQAHAALAQAETKIQTSAASLAETRALVEDLQAQLATQQAETAAAEARRLEAVVAQAMLVAAVDETNGRLDRAAAAALEERTTLECQLKAREAELALSEALARDIANAAQVCATLQAQTASEMTALSKRVHSAETELETERKTTASLLAEIRGCSERAATALAKSEARGDRAVGQLEAERSRVKDATERAMRAEASLNALRSAAPKSTLNRIRAAMGWSIAPIGSRTVA